MLEDFDISREETDFAFLCYCISQWHVRDTYVLRHPPEYLPRTTVSRSEKKVFIRFEIWIFIFQKRMDSLQEAFIHNFIQLCEAWFITDARTLFDVFRTVYSKHPFIPIVRLGGARTIFYITQIGFV